MEVKYLQSLPITSIRFWINVVIPEDIPGVTVKIPSGPYKGKTMIPHPVNPRLGYLTDQRSFSNDLKAPSRLHSIGTLRLNGIYPNLKDDHKSDDTVELEVKSGSQTCRIAAEEWTKGKNVFGLLVPWMSMVKYERDLIVVEVGAAASNPCSPASKYLGQVEYSGTTFIDLSKLTISFYGKIKEVPAYEMYAQLDNELPVALFQEGLALQHDWFGNETNQPKKFSALMEPMNRVVVAPERKLRNTPYDIDGILRLGRKFTTGLQEAKR